MNPILSSFAVFEIVLRERFGYIEILIAGVKQKTAQGNYNKWSTL